MANTIFKQPFFYIALLNFALAIVFIFQDGLLARLASFVWFLSFLFNFHHANKAAHKK